MIGSYRPLRQTGKNSVCIRRIVCIRLSYQSGGCKSVESSFTGRALETSSKIEDCKGSPSLERGDGPPSLARKRQQQQQQQKKTSTDRFPSSSVAFLAAKWLVGWLVGWSARAAAWWRRVGGRRLDGGEEEIIIIRRELLVLLHFLPSLPPLLLVVARKAGDVRASSTVDVQGGVSRYGCCRCSCFFRNILEVEVGRKGGKPLLAAADAVAARLPSFLPSKFLL